ncbi:MAG: family 16 glycosylhydrolase [Bacteroidales bacterium]|nr:family 16 glycosylhydrolase [Bacteroidales bacterium]
MKKFVYLCAMLLLTLNMMAQIDLNDRNWERVFNDEFTMTGRSWKNWSSFPDKKWRGYGGATVIGGITEHQVYQYSNCLFCPAEGVMKLVAEYCDTIWKNTYPLPSWMENNYPSNNSLFYFSGEIDARKDSIESLDLGFQYGYFEIRCKLPQHKGTFPAFWLHTAHRDTIDTSNNYYEEIDIFEHSRSLLHTNPHWPGYIPPSESDSARVFTSGIYHNLTGVKPDFDTESFARKFHLVSPLSNDLSDWHTFSCEWMPDYVYFYFDENMINSYFDKEHIPCHSMILKTNYAIDDHAIDKNTNQPVWIGSDLMVIDYIRVYQLKWDCNTDETIMSQTDLDNFDFKVKKSITITPSIGEVVIGNTDKVTFRVADSFEITGPFQADNGCEFTVILQDCPE